MIPSSLDHHGLCSGQDQRDDPATTEANLEEHVMEEEEVGEPEEVGKPHHADHHSLEPMDEAPLNLNGAAVHHIGNMQQQQHQHVPAAAADGDLVWGELLFGAMHAPLDPAWGWMLQPVPMGMEMDMAGFLPFHGVPQGAGAWDPFPVAGFPGAGFGPPFAGFPGPGFGPWGEPGNMATGAVFGRHVLPHEARQDTAVQRGVGVGTFLPAAPAEIRRGQRYVRPVARSGDVNASLPAPSPGAGGATRTFSSQASPAGGAAGCGAVPADDAVSSKRRALLFDVDSPVVFAGMEEAHDNGWYDSIVRDAEMQEKAEDPELRVTPTLETPNEEEDESNRRNAVAALTGGEEEHIDLNLSLHAPALMIPAPNDQDEHHSRAAVAADEEGRVLSICKKWGIRPSDLDPDDAGPSTKRQPRVLPLADDDIATFDCGICLEMLPVLNLFHGMPCEHRFCAVCMATYVEGRVRDGAVPIRCPDPACKGEENGVLHPEECKKAIDFAAFGDWGAQLAEGAIAPNRRAYCPNSRCGVLLETSGEKKPAMAPCPACALLLCATCGMEWSTDDSGEHDCDEGPDAVLVKRLAEERRWKQCPKCKMMVERTEGCRVMNCRCNVVFCYDCGRPMTVALEEGGVVCQCNTAQHFIIIVD